MLTDKDTTKQYQKPPMKVCPLMSGLVEKPSAFSAGFYSDLETAGCLGDDCMFYMNGECAFTLIARSLAKLK